MNLTYWLMLVILSLFWGGSFFFIGVAVSEVKPLTIVMMRLTTAAAMLWVFLIISGIKVPKDWRIWCSFFFIGLVNNALPFTLITWAQTGISSGLASIFNAATPLFTLLIAGTMLGDEKFTITKTTGMLIGFSGVIVMVGPAALHGLSGELLPQLSILLAAFCYGIANTYGRKIIAKGIDTRVIATGQVTASSIIIVVITLIVEHPLEELATASVASWSAMISLGLVSTALAYLIYFHLLSKVGATNLSLVTFLVPVSAIFLGIFILNERLKLEEVIGMTLIAFGLIYIDGRLPKKMIAYGKNWRRQNTYES